MPTEIKWSDKPGPRERRAWLLLVTDGAVARFAGQTIPGVAVVRGKAYRKNGKWSNTTFDLVLGDGVRAIPGRMGFNSGTFEEGLSAATRHETPTSWPEMAGCLGVDADEARRFLVGFAPAVVVRLDTVAAELAALEAP